MRRVCSRGGDARQNMSVRAYRGGAADLGLRAVAIDVHPLAESAMKIAVAR